MWKKQCELWDNIQRNNLHILGIPEEEREEETEIVLKAIIPDKSQIGPDLDIQVHVANRSPLEFIQNYSLQDTFPVIKTKREFYQEESKCSQKRNSLKNIIGFLRINLAGQERIGWYIQSDESKNLPTKKTFLRKVVFQKWRWCKDFLKQTTVEEVHQHRFVLQITEGSSWR